MVDLPKIDKRSFLLGSVAGGAAIAGGIIGVQSLKDKWEGFTFRAAGLDDRYFNSMADFNPSTRRIGLHYNLTPSTKPETRWRGRSIYASTDLPQGLYIIENEVGVRAPVAVTAKPGKPSAPTVVLIPDYTFHAYNRVGGGSLYTSNDWVEMRRPRVNSWYSSFGYAPIDLLEEAGVTFDLILQSDLDVPDYDYDLAAYGKIVLYGHDEYWTASIRGQIERAVAAGTTLVNLSGNTSWWNLSRDGYLINRNKLGYWYQDSEFGPEERLLGVAWRFAGYPIARRVTDENAEDVRNGLLEFDFPSEHLGDDFDRMTGSIRITNPDAQVLAGTGVARGAWLTGSWPILDIEIDGLPLDRDGNIDLERTKGFIPDELEVAAEGWGLSGSKRINKGLNRFAFLVKSRFRKAGYVHSLPSISWVRAAQETDGVLRTITRNALTA